MEKILQASTGVVNVGIGQQCTHNLRKGPFYHHLTYYVTITKTAATTGFTSATLADAIGAIEVRVNTEAKRSFLAIELEAIQQAWGAIYATKQYDQLGNDMLTTIADTISGGNTTRTTTFEFNIYFCEPWRDSYTARRFFGLPTAWADGKTVDIQIAIKTPTTGYTSNPVIRCDEFLEFTLGPTAVPKGAAAGSKPVDVLPMVNFWRINQNYSASQLQINQWGSTKGQLQQISIFGQANDYLQTYVLKCDNVPKRQTTKIGNDNLSNRYDWQASNNTLATPYDPLNVTHIAADVADDPMDWINYDAYKSVELDLTLSQAAAANKNLVLIVQAYALYVIP